MKDSKPNDNSLYMEVQQLWSIEKQLVDAIPLMIEKAANTGLKRSLAHHLAETTQHLTSIEFIAKHFNKPPQGTENILIKKIINEGNKYLNDGMTNENLDEAIIGLALKIEKHEISMYGSAAYNAHNSGYVFIASKLRAIQEEELQAENKLKFHLKNLEMVLN